MGSIETGVGMPSLFFEFPRTTGVCEKNAPPVEKGRKKVTEKCLKTRFKKNVRTAFVLAEMSP